jgi:hypothetical protein
MNTLTLPRQRRSPYKSPSTRPLGQDTQNVSFSIGRNKIAVNLYDLAVQIMDEVYKPNRSLNIKLAIIRDMGARFGVATGLAFRAACRLSNEVATGIRSIFSPGSPDQKAEAFAAKLAEEKAEKANEVPTGGASLIEDLTKTMPSGEFVPTK